jgi:hypothetical protein
MRILLFGSTLCVSIKWMLPDPLMVSVREMILEVFYFGKESQRSLLFDGTKSSKGMEVSPKGCLEPILLDA